VHAPDPASIAAGWLADADLRAFLGVHEAGGTTWLQAERLATLAEWTRTLAIVEGSEPSGALATALDGAVRAAAKAGYAVDGWLAALGGSSPPKARTRSAKTPPGKSRAVKGRPATNAAAVPRPRKPSR
jgi:hypothetical protein